MNFVRPIQMPDTLDQTSSNSGSPLPRICLLTSSELPDVKLLFTGLEQEARLHRFGLHTSDDMMCTNADRAVSTAAWIIGAFFARTLRGVAEVHGDPGSRGEFALVVEKDWRRRGIGWSLLQAAMQCASAANMSSLHVTFSRHNWPMRKLIWKSGACIDLVVGDELTAEICIAR
jgi:GNAT superfamily N-acetyltransferase